ncbi:hypothetical protein YOLOSWAG_318 [Erwinia phage vB_EamM_Yoloswag]|uniref:Uncharacterized protein n=1 Tax=Erwinia phage vB_EamM_Yoloswag TaxID=1958956 RepID=A0A1S6L3N3_9CAUD|nr:hypothetical protein HOR66_gp318 [Erwinia phage vB_EamM_Yoloswag]AQT28787.1 hypothetical protein YOLOSWAG_318 [Erwinia phage vB_EamM_Yoloswag]
MTDQNTNGSAKSSAEEQQRVIDQNRHNTAAASQDKTALFVVLAPTNADNEVSNVDCKGDFFARQLETKAIDRLPDMLSHVSQGLKAQHSAYDLLLPQNGVPTSIDARVQLNEQYDAKIVRYTVNVSKSALMQRLSMAIFDVAGDRNIYDVAAQYGIHAIVLSDDKQAVNVLRELESQLVASKADFNSVIDIDDDALNTVLINVNTLPANPSVLIEGVRRTFAIQNANGQLLAPSKIGEQTVVDKNNGPVDLDEDNFESVDQDNEQSDEEEVATGRALLGYQADSLTQEQKIEALTAIDYDCSEMDEEAIDEAFLVEQEKFLDSEDEDSEEESDEESEEAEDFDAAGEITAILEQYGDDRDQIKRLVRAAELKVLVADTAETLAAKLIAHVEDMNEEQFAEFLTDLIAAVEGKPVDVAPLNEWFDDTDSTDEEEDEESEDEDEQDEDEDEDEQQSAIDAITDPLDYFDYAGGDLTPEQRISAVEAMGHSTEGLNIIKVMKLFNRLKEEVSPETLDEEDEQDALQVQADLDEEEEIADESEDVVKARAYLAAAAADDLSIIAELVGADATDLDEEQTIEAVLFEGDIDNLIAAADTYGVEADSDISYWELLVAFLESYFSEDDSEEADFGQDEPQSENESILAQAGVENNSNPLGIEAVSGADNSGSLKFLRNAHNSPAGTLMSVDMPQSLIINFTLTDRASFEEFNEELQDVDGLNYRFPFVRPKKANKAQGAMYQPAASLIEIMEQTATSRFMVDTNQFDVGQFSEALNASLATSVENNLYDGLLEPGANPHEEGLKLGDFVDDEELTDDEIAPEYWDEFQGADLPMHGIINGFVGVRPVQIEELHSVLCLGVLNVAVPGIWELDRNKVGELLDGAINAVKSLLAPNNNIKVHVGFTLSSASLIVDDTLMHVVNHLRDQEMLYSYSSADCALFADNEDVLEAAASLDNSERLPLELLSTGFAGKTFENGGDLTILVPCFEIDADEDEDEADEE